MFKVKLSQLQKLTDDYSYTDNTYELKIVEEDGEKYVEINEKSELNKDRIAELQILIKRVQENLQDNVSRYMCTLNNTDYRIMKLNFEKLKDMVSELKMLKGKEIQ